MTPRGSASASVAVLSALGLAGCVPQEVAVRIHAVDDDATDATGGEGTPNGDTAGTGDSEPAGPWTLAFEAESGNLTPTFIVVSDAATSGGAFVRDDAGQGLQGPGAAAYSLTLEGDADRDLIFWGRIRAETGGTDSFFVSFDGGAVQTYFTAACVWNQEWRWTFVNGQGGAVCPYDPTPWGFTLSPGEHELVLTSREGQSAIDRIVLTDDPSFVPVD